MFPGLQLPPVIKNLIILNALIWLATLVGEDVLHYPVSDLMGLHAFESDLFQPYQLVTHFFMHGGLMHLAFNMFALWMFGSQLEAAFGPKRFLIYYVSTAIGAGLLYEGYVEWDLTQLQHQVDAFMSDATPDAFSIFVRDNLPLDLLAPQYHDAVSTTRAAFYDTPDSTSLASYAGKLMQAWVDQKRDTPMVGASGAVFGVLLGFGLLFPDQRIMLLFFPVPIQAKYFVIGYAAIELYSGLQNDPYDNVAHFAHLAGALVGFVLIKLWRMK